MSPFLEIYLGAFLGFLSSMLVAAVFGLAAKRYRRRGVVATARRLVVQEWATLEQISAHLKGGRTPGIYFLPDGFGALQGAFAADLVALKLHPHLLPLSPMLRAMNSEFDRMSQLELHVLIAESKGISATELKSQVGAKAERAQRQIEYVERLLIRTFREIELLGGRPEADESRVGSVHRLSLRAKELGFDRCVS